MLDNGNVNRGNLEATLRTPAGDFTGGYDQDTNYAQYTSPNRIENYPGINLYYAGDNVSPKELNISTGRNDAGDRDISAFLTGLPIKETSYNEINTPLGVLGYGKNAQDEVNAGSVYGDFTPNEYIQALLRLLGK